MKSIEERAKEYTHRYATPFLSGLETAEYEAYKAGATEQKKIDIEKACDLFCKVHCQNGCILQEGFVCSKFMAFRKAMEESPCDSCPTNDEDPVMEILDFYDDSDQTK